MRHPFSKANRLALWLFYQIPRRFWYGYSILNLQEKMLKDFIAAEVPMLIPVPQTHRSLIGNYFPIHDLIEYVPVDVSYDECFLHIHDFSKFVSRRDFRWILNLEGMNQLQLLAPFQSRLRAPRLVNYVLFCTQEEHVVPLVRNSTVMGYLERPTIFNGPVSYWETIALAKNLASEDVMRLAQAKHLRIASLGVDCDEMEKFRPRKYSNGKKGVLKLLYGGRLKEHKAVDLTLQIVQDTLKQKNAVALKKRVTYRVRSYGDPLNEKKLKAFEDAFDFVDVRFNEPREAFYRDCFSSDLFICASEIESYGLSYFEMLYGGMVGLFLRQPWQAELLPPEYPYIYDDTHELKRALRWVFDHPEEAKNKIAHIPDWIRRHQNMSNHYFTVLKTLNELISDQKLDNLKKKRFWGGQPARLQ